MKRDPKGRWCKRCKECHPHSVLCFCNATPLRKALKRIRSPKPMPKRAIRAAEWLIEECRKCPKGYGMTIDFGVSDCPDIMLVLLHGIRAGLKTRHK